MKKLLLILLLLPAWVMAQQTRPTNPQQKPQNSAYIDLATGIRWYFDGVNWFAIPPYSPPNTVLTGLSMTVIGSTLTVHTGTWRIGNVVYTLGSNTNFTLKPRDTITHYYRYEAVYAIGANNGIGLKVDSLTPAPIQHQFGTDTLTVGYVLVTPTGYQVVPPTPTNQFVFSNIGISSPTQQVGSYPSVTTMKADTFKVGNYYIWPSYRGNSGDVPQLDAGGNVFWSPQAIYLPAAPITLTGPTFGIDTTVVSTIVGMLDTLKKNAAHFNPKQFVIGNDTINLNPKDTTTVDSGLFMHGGRLYKAPASTGSSYTFNNGLTNTAGTVQLGGALVQPTEIDATGNTFDVAQIVSSTEYNKFLLSSNSIAQMIARNSSTNYALITANKNAGNPFITIISNSGATQKSITLQTNLAGIVFSDAISQIGGKYLNDYSTNQRLNQLAIPSVKTVILLADSVKGTISGGITALTGDVTASGSGSVAATLATVNSNVGSFTNANITVNAKGLITAAANGSGGGLTTSNFVWSEVPSGTVNSSNVTFTLANTPTSGTVRLYQNGLRLKLTTDYSISSGTITFVTAPTTGDLILSDYMK